MQKQVRIKVSSTSQNANKACLQFLGNLSNLMWAHIISTTGGGKVSTRCRGNKQQLLTQKHRSMGQSGGEGQCCRVAQHAFPVHHAALPPPLPAGAPLI